MADEPWDQTRPDAGPAAPPPMHLNIDRGQANPNQANPNQTGSDRVDLTKPTGPGSVAFAPTGQAAGSGVSGVRASDEDRKRIVEWLCWAAGNGQLSLDEVDSRLSAAYAARTVGELTGLTTDLQPKPPEPEPERERGWIERLRDSVPAVPLLISLLLVLFLAAAVAGGAHAAFPLLIVASFLIIRSQHRRHRMPRYYPHPPRPSHQHHHYHHHRYQQDRYGYDQRQPSDPWRYPGAARDQPPAVPPGRPTSQRPLWAPPPAPGPAYPSGPSRPHGPRNGHRYGYGPDDQPPAPQQPPPPPPPPPDRR